MKIQIELFLNLENVKIVEKEHTEISMVHYNLQPTPPSSVPTAVQKARRKSQPCHELAASRHWASQAKRWANSGIAIIARVIFDGHEKRPPEGGLNLLLF